MKSLVIKTVRSRNSALKPIHRPKGCGVMDESREYNWCAVCGDTKDIWITTSISTCPPDYDRVVIPCPACVEAKEVV
jgi:hypothetical protein